MKVEVARVLQSWSHFDGDHPSGLSLEKGRLVLISERDEKRGLCYGECDGRFGFFPEKFVSIAEVTNRSRRLSMQWRIILSVLRYKERCPDMSIWQILDNIIIFRAMRDYPHEIEAKNEKASPISRSSVSSKGSGFVNFHIPAAKLHSRPYNQSLKAPSREEQLKFAAGEFLLGIRGSESDDEIYGDARGVMGWIPLLHTKSLEDSQLESRTKIQLGQVRERFSKLVNRGDSQIPVGISIEMIELGNSESLDQSFDALGLNCSRPSLVRDKRDQFVFETLAPALDNLNSDTRSAFFAMVDKELLRVDTLYNQRAKFIAAASTNLQDISELRENISELVLSGLASHEALSRLVRTHDSSHPNYAMSVRYEAALRRQTFCRVATLQPLLQILSDKIHALSATDDSRVSAAAVPGSSKNSGDNFERDSIKFLVRHGDVPQLIIAILQHLPLYSFDGKSFGQKVSSVYLDNSKFKLFHNREAKFDGAQLIRVRWYGELNANTPLFIERKTHREKWTGNKSRKERFRLTKNHLCLRYLHGTLTAKEAGIQKELYAEIQALISSEKLTSKIRTEYFRSAFQFPGVDQVRMSLDENLRLYKETVDFKQGWFTKDQDFVPDDIYLLPFAVLEVKIADVPKGEDGNYVGRWAWVNSFLRNPLIHHMDRFSKYLHACAIHYESSLRVKPQWWHSDIQEWLADPRVPSDNVWTCNRLQNWRSLSFYTPNPLEDEDVPASSADQQQSAAFPELPLPDLNHQTGNSKHIRAPSLVNRSDFLNKARSTPAAHVAIDMDTTPVTTPVKRGKGRLLVEKLKGLSSSTPRAAESSPIHSSPIRSPRSKMKVEPKTYFANERTFIQWFQAAAMLASFAIAILASPSGNLEAGYVLSGMALCILAYALRTYLRRYQSLNKTITGTEAFKDPVGPVILSVCVIVGLVLGVVGMREVAPKLPTEPSDLLLWMHVDEASLPAFKADYFQTTLATLAGFSYVDVEPVISNMSDVITVKYNLERGTHGIQIHQTIPTQTLDNQSELWLVLPIAMENAYPKTSRIRDPTCTSTPSHVVVEEVINAPNDPLAPFVAGKGETNAPPPFKQLIQFHSLVTVADMESGFPDVHKYLQAAPWHAMEPEIMYQRSSRAEIMVDGVMVEWNMKINYADAISYLQQGTPDNINLGFRVMKENIQIADRADTVYKFTDSNVLLGRLQDMYSTLIAESGGMLKQPPCSKDSFSWLN